jgi:hypothetical protein
VNEDMYLIDTDGVGNNEALMTKVSGKDYLVVPAGKGAVKFEDKAMSNMSWSPLPIETVRTK